MSKQEGENEGAPMLIQIVFGNIHHFKGSETKCVIIEPPNGKNKNTFYASRLLENKKLSPPEPLQTPNIEPYVVGTLSLRKILRLCENSFGPDNDLETPEEFKKRQKEKIIEYSKLPKVELYM